MPSGVDGLDAQWRLGNWGWNENYGHPMNWGERPEMKQVVNLKGERFDEL